MEGFRYSSAEASPGTPPRLQAFGVVRLYRTFSIYSSAGETRCAGCFCTSSGWFKHSEPPRTYSNHNITKLARCGEVCHLRSGWFDCTEPSLATMLQGKQGVQGAYAIVRGGSSTANLIEPTRTVVRLYRTFSIFTSNLIEPPRTPVTNLSTPCLAL